LGEYKINLDPHLHFHLDPLEVELKVKKKTIWQVQSKPLLRWVNQILIFLPMNTNLLIALLAISFLKMWCSINSKENFPIIINYHSFNNCNIHLHNHYNKWTVNSNITCLKVVLSQHERILIHKNFALKTTKESDKLS